MSKERQESTFEERTYPTLAINIPCPKCKVPDLFYEPRPMIKNKKNYMVFDFQCHSCQHEWTTTGKA